MFYNVFKNTDFTQQNLIDVINIFDQKITENKLNLLRSLWILVVKTSIVSVEVIKIIKDNDTETIQHKR